MATENAYPDTGVHLPLEDDQLRKIQSTVNPLMLTLEQERRLMDTLRTEMWLGMSRDAAKRQQTSLQMENTFVRSLLDGTEQGDYLALDLGGTNFRVLLCRMKDGECFESVSQNYNVPTPKLYGPTAEVFDHIAESIYLFLKEKDILESRLPLGFTFSFPMIQEGLKKGILVTWTKSFACPDGVGQDAVQLLEDALARRGDVMVDVVAVLNDTTGTLMAGSYLDKECGIGLIMGTGCNAAYVEHLDNVDKWSGPKTDPMQVVIDTECGAFGDNGSIDFLKTDFDRIIDLHSNHVGSFTYEKLFSGHYVGDIARLVLLRLAEDGVLFQGQLSKELSRWNTFTASHLSNIIKDTEDNTQYTDQALTDLGLSSVASSQDKAVIHHICQALSIRASQIVSCTIATLLLHMKRHKQTVAIDGSLYRYHPTLHDMMMAKIAELAPENQCELILAEDGSGRGAAFVAAVACRMEKQTQKSSQSTI